MVAEIVDEDDLLEVARRRAVQRAPDGAHQRRPGLVVVNDDDRRRGEVLVVGHFAAASVPDVGQ